jgi:peptidyl-prolyl cis-trans isomerase C
MRVSIPKARVWAVTAVAVLLVAVITPFAMARINDLPDHAVFRLGDTVVTEDQLGNRVAVLEALYGVTRPSEGKGVARFDRDVAKSLAVSMILEQAAAERDIVIADKTAQSELDKVVDEQLPEGRDGFVEFLGTSGVSESEVLDEIKRQLATSRLVEEVAGDVPPATDAEVRAAYDKNRDSMVSPEKRHLLNIVVGSKTEAERVLRRAEAGASIRSLAVTWSRDGATRDKGGDLGTLSADQLEADFAEAAFSVPAGATFGPVQTRHGWNVGQVAEVQPATPLSFEQVREQLALQLLNGQRLTTWRAWLADRIKAAAVEYADRYRPAHPDAAPNALPE